MGGFSRRQDRIRQPQRCLAWFSPHLVSEVSLSFPGYKPTLHLPTTGHLVLYTHPQPPALVPNPLLSSLRSLGSCPREGPAGPGERQGSVTGGALASEGTRIETRLWHDSPGFCGFMPPPNPEEDLGAGEELRSPLQGLPRFLPTLLLPAPNPFWVTGPGGKGG